MMLIETDEALPSRVHRYCKDALIGNPGNLSQL